MIWMMKCMWVWVGNIIYIKWVVVVWKNRSQQLSASKPLRVARDHVGICHLQSRNQAISANQKSSQCQNLKFQFSILIYLLPIRRLLRPKTQLSTQPFFQSSVYRKIMARRRRLTKSTSNVRMFPVLKRTVHKPSQCTWSNFHFPSSNDSLNPISFNIKKGYKFILCPGASPLSKVNILEIVFRTVSLFSDRYNKSNSFRVGWRGFRHEPLVHFVR